MTTEIEPVRGNWYRQLDKGQTFVVIEIDDDDGIVEIQHYDGDLEQIELEAWKQMDLELTEEPENWTGPVDDVETDDLDYTETDMSRDDWRSGLQESHRPRGERWQDPSPDDEREEWTESTSAEDSYGAERGGR